LGMTVFWQPRTSTLSAVLMIALQLSRESYTVFPLSTAMEVRPLQPWKASSPMLVTELGMIVFLQPTISSLSAVLMMALQLPRES
jgi:hypothetical protein